jgi:hypothetical protein
MSISKLLFVIAVLGSVVRGQTPSAPQTRPGRPDPVQRELERQAEVKLIERALSEGRLQKVQRYPVTVLAEIKADFLGIQMADRKLVQATTSGNALDLPFVVRSTSEIRKLAKRLKKNLDLPPLPEPARPDIGVQAEMESIQVSLKALSRLIDELVTNPMFEQAKLINPQLAARALWDLEAIIELSGQVKRSSEKLQSIRK